MIHRQETHGPDTPRYYAWCTCGVCGPLRVDKLDAKLDERAHAQVCSARKATA